MKKYVLQNKGLTMGVFVFSLIASSMLALIALFLREILDVAINLDLEGFNKVLIQAMLFFVVLGVVHYIYMVLSKTLIAKLIESIRKDAFNGMMEQNMSQFKEVNSADYISALTNDIQLLEENYFVPILTVVENIIVFIVSLGVMFYLSPLITGALLLTLVFLIIIPSLFGRSIQQKQEQLSNRLSLFTIKSKDIFTGFEVIKSYQIKDRIQKDFQTENQQLFRSKVSLERLYALTTAISLLLGLLSQVGVIFLSAYLIIKGHLTAGALIGLVQVSSMITGPIQALSASIPQIQGSKKIIERLQLFTTHKTHDTRTQTATFDQFIKLQNLEFTYPKSEEAVLKQINLTFEKHKKYALIGQSGCGKTTLVQLLTGHLDGYSGEILYDKTELNQLTNESVVNLSAMIHQNIYLFDETIEDNITLKKTYSQSELEIAIKNSGVYLFLKGSKTLQSAVGENGANLSGGQRQRIAVARALIQNKPLLILDEGTSAMDKPTAVDIENRLLKQEQLTLLTITHSLNPEILERYDEIIYMEAGTIVEKGTFSDLIQKQGSFYQYLNQKVGN